MYWGLGIVKIFYGFLTFNKIKLDWKIFWIIIVSLLLLFEYLLTHLLIGDYTFKVVFFVGTIILMVRVKELFNNRHKELFIKNNEMLFIIGLIVILCNIIFVLISGQSLYNNAIAAESERMRGYFPYFISTVYLVELDDKKKFLFRLLLFSIVAYLLEGTRGSVVVFIITTIAVKYLSVKQFYFLSVLQILIYPVIVISLVYLIPPLSGQQDTSFSVKSSGFIYLLSNLTINGIGILPPTTYWISPADRFGFHFIPADYGFLGAVFELGILLPIFRVCCLVWVCKQIPYEFDVRYKNIIIYFLFSIAGSYGMANDYSVLITNFISLVVITQRSKLIRWNIRL